MAVHHPHMPLRPDARPQPQKNVRRTHLRKPSPLIRGAAASESIGGAASKRRPRRRDPFPDPRKISLTGFRPEFTPLSLRDLVLSLGASEPKILSIKTKGFDYSSFCLLLPDSDFDLVADAVA